MFSASDWMKQISTYQKHYTVPSFLSHRSFSEAGYRVFSHDLTAAILMFLSNETTPMSVSQTSPLVVEFFSSVNAFFCPNEFGTVDSGRVNDNALFFLFKRS